MVGADVKNYIRAYYRDTAVLGRRATVLRLQGSGTTVGPAVLPRGASGTTVGAADVKNYIRPYYHTGAALGQSAAVLPRQRSGTTVRGTDVKNYIRPYYRAGAALGQGTAVLPRPRGGTTVACRGTTACTAVVDSFSHNHDNEG